MRDLGGGGTVWGLEGGYGCLRYCGSGGLCGGVLDGHGRTKKQGGRSSSQQHKETHDGDFVLSKFKRKAGEFPKQEPSEISPISCLMTFARLQKFKT